MNNEEVSKKLDELETEIEKSLTTQVFVSFLPLATSQELETVWRNAQRSVYSRLNALSSTNKKKAEELIKEHVKYTNQLKFQNEWSKLTLLEALFTKYKKAYLFECTFLFSLTVHQIYKWKSAKIQFAKYCFKSTIEKRIVENRKIAGKTTPKPDISLVFETPEIMVKNPDGEFDINEAKKREDIKNNLKAQLSAFSHIPQIQAALLNQIKSISKHPFMYTLYKKTAEKAIWTATLHQSYYAAHFVYDQMQKGITKKEAEQNGIEFMKTLPQRDTELKMEIDGENLWEQLTSVLGEDDELSEEDSRLMFAEILNALFVLCVTEVATPENYFDVEFRESTDDEKDMENSNYSVEVHMLDDASQRIPDISETYVVGYTTESLIEMLNFVTNGRVNPNLYPPFPGMLLGEQLISFLDNPWGFLEKKQTVALSKSDLIESLIETQARNTK